MCQLVNVSACHRVSLSTCQLVNVKDFPEIQKYLKVPRSTSKVPEHGLVWSGPVRSGPVRTVWNILEQFGTLRAISGWDGTGLDDYP